MYFNAATIDDFLGSHSSRGSFYDSLAHSGDFAAPDGKVGAILMLCCNTWFQSSLAVLRCPSFIVAASGCCRGQRSVACKECCPYTKLPRSTLQLRKELQLAPTRGAMLAQLTSS